MSRSCVARDLDRVRLAFRDRMTFVVVENALPRIPGEAERRAGLLGRRAARPARAAARPPARRVLRRSADRRPRRRGARRRRTSTGPELEFLRGCNRAEDRELDKLLDVLEHVNEDAAVTERRRSGTGRSADWRSPTACCAATPQPAFVALRPQRRAAHRPAAGSLRRTRRAHHRPAMPLREVLDALAHRFGILIDRPPAFLDGAEAREAATANREAFTSGSSYSGCFDSLSDDFSVQVVRHPLGDPA